MYSDHQHLCVLTSLMVQHGVRHVVVCPGNRNAPLVHNFSVCPDITCHSVTDERSAGFVALGLADALDSPVAVCVTSGSALLATLPAAAEATYRNRGIVVISADRPVAWIGQLDGQTLPQDGALSPFVSLSVTLPEVHSAEDHWHCNRLVNEAFVALQRAPHSSVHINVPIAEPLFGFSTKVLPPERVVGYATYQTLRAAEQLSSRTILVVGQMRRALPRELMERLSQGMVVLAEQLSCNDLCCTDQMVHLVATQGMPQGMVPETVVYVGGNTVSKRLRQWLRRLPESTRQVVVSDDGTLHDVSQNTTMLVEGKVEEVLHALCAAKHPVDAQFMAMWQRVRSSVEWANAHYAPAYSSMLAVRMLEERAGKEPAAFCYANSMSVRLGCLFARHYIYCNRGLNGIEGSLSTAVGMALARPDRYVYCVIGDLSAFYDQTVLSQQELGGNLRLLLLNNGGGAIFRSFPQLEESPARDTFVSASHHLTAEGLCAQCGIRYLRATDEHSLTEGVDALVHSVSPRPVLLEVLTDGDTDMKVYTEYYKFITDNYGMDHN